MTRELPLTPIDEAAFAPFGLVLRRPAPGDPRRTLAAELANGRASAAPRLSLVAAPPHALPLTATKMERHVHSSQTFVPLECESFLVLVAPKGANGWPDLTGVRAFRVPGDVGVHYLADTWHHPLTALGRPASFATLTFLDDGPLDEDWFTLPEPLLVSA